MAKARSAVPEGLHTITPQLTLDHASEAIAWYIKALGGSPMALWVYVDDCDAQGRPHPAGDAAAPGQVDEELQRLIHA